MNKSRRAHEEPNWNAHPPGREESNNRSAGPLGQRRINKAKLNKLELRKILRRDSIANLIMCNAIETGS